MISNILLAVDGSHQSSKAVQIASQIAQGVNAKLVLLHVVKLYEMPEAMKQFVKNEHIPGPTNIDVLMNAAQHMLKGEVERAQSAGVTEVEMEVEQGSIARTIIATAKRHNSDLIVLGSRGMGDIEGLLRGGVSHRVEILAKCPVLIVK
jgi:nucleotide-binding universal stress UspA family protein